MALDEAAAVELVMAGPEECRRLWEAHRPECAVCLRAPTVARCCSRGNQLLVSAYPELFRKYGTIAWEALAAPSYPP